MSNESEISPKNIGWSSKTRLTALKYYCDQTERRNSCLSCVLVFTVS